MKNSHINILFVVFICIAAAFRLPQLSERPLHADEAVHAVKFGELLENNAYRYDPHEYHGPTLNYLTLIPAWLRGQHTFAELDEWTIRLVPVFFGLLMIPMLLWFRNGLDRITLLAAALFLSISPAFVFYSRYYIQEVLFVCFNLGVIAAAHRFFVTRKATWALAIGLFLGLMHATKETCILPWWTMGMALVVTLLWQIFRADPKEVPFPKPSLKHILLLCGSGLVISTLFFSSFGFNPHGILDSITTYTTYFNRASGHDWHIHPWYTYFQWMLFYQASGLRLWSEGAIFLLGLVGMVATIRNSSTVSENKSLVRFLVVHTLLLTLIYSLIPYKTPWSFLGVWMGWILLAGTGVSVLKRWIMKPIFRTLFFILLGAAILHLTEQAYQLNFRYYDHPGNPYTYSHPREDVKRIAQYVKDVAEASQSGHDTYVDVVCTGADYWPLPWYLRDMSTVGWWDEIRMDLPAAPIILACPRVEEALIQKLYEVPPPGQKHLYLPLYDEILELRPKVELRGYIRKDYWDDYQQKSQ